VEEIEKDKYGLSDEQAWFRASCRLECGEMACNREHPNCIDNGFAMLSLGSKNLISGQSIGDAMVREFWQ
jgi:hypothetical protein